MSYLLSFVVALSLLSASPSQLDGIRTGEAYRVSTTSPGTLKYDDPPESPTPTPTPTPTPDPELEEANRQTQLANAARAKAEADAATATARKNAAEADKAALDLKIAALKAKLGLGGAEPSPTPASGNVTGDQKFIETQILAELSARKASQQLLTKLCASTNSFLTTNHIKKIVVHSAGDRSGVETYKAMVAQLGFFHKEYERLLNDAAKAQAMPDKAPDVTAPKPEGESGALVPLLLPAATQAVKGFAELVNMFRTETEFKDQQVTVDARMIVTFLAGDVLAGTKGVCEVSAIYYPSVYPVGIEAGAADGTLMQVYYKVGQDVSRGDVMVASNNEMIATLTKQIEALGAQITALKAAIEEHSKPAPAESSERGKKKPDNPGPPFDLKKARIQLAQATQDQIVIKSKIEMLKRTAANIDAFKTAIADALKLMTTAESGNTQTVLTGLLRAERLNKILAEINTYALDLTVRASGTNRTRRNAFFNTKIAHSGGVSISTNLFNNQDELIFGRVEDYYIEFAGSKEIRKKAGFESLNPSFAQ